MRLIIRVNSIAIYFIFVLLFFNILITSNVGAAGERLQIESEEEVDEGEYFPVSVYDPEDFDNPSPYLVDVTIKFNGAEYQIAEDGEVSIKAPDVSEDTYYPLNASKPGYASDEKKILVKNSLVTNKPKLTIVPEKKTVDVGNRFSVTVKDDTGHPVSGVIVAIQNFGDKPTTDNEGAVWLTAPPEDWGNDTFTIIAQKYGYGSGETTIGLNRQESWLSSIIKNQYFPVFIGVILLISAVVFVNFRQKRYIYSRAKELTDNKTIEKYNLDTKVTLSADQDKEKQENQYYSRDAVRAQQGQDAKVEEIRISRPAKDKEIVPVKSKEDETEKVINRKKLQGRGYDWFEGTDEMRYEIEKLTGDVNEDDIDKWFEGVDGLKEKINEKIKKKDKNKSNDNN